MMMISMLLLSLLAHSLAFRVHHRHRHSTSASVHISRTLSTSASSASVSFSSSSFALSASDSPNLEVEDLEAYDLSEDELLVQRVAQEVMSESGVELDQLINPGKVVNLERDLAKLGSELSTCSDAARIEEINELMDKKQKTLFIEKRSVMRGWLKNLFVGQSVIAGIISLGMVYDAYPNIDLPLPIKVLGFWMWWLFIIPSLRARKPANAEKEALNISFLANPLISVLMPTFTKDLPTIWWANAATMGACYAFAYYNEANAEPSEGDDEEKSVLPKFVVKGLNALDYGSGKERGVRK